MTKNQIIAEHIIVTFFEAGIAYLAINQTDLSGNWKTAAIGALGAGIAAAYNYARQSKPTIPTPVQTEIGSPPLASTMNGIDQLTSPTPQIPSPPDVTGV